MTYTPPLADLRFMLQSVGDLDALARLPGFEAATPELVDAVLAEAGRLAAEVLAPLNRPGDVQGCRLENGVVRTPDGFADAFAAFAAGGWIGLPVAEEHGGQGLPWAVANAVGEMWHAANMAFGLNPLLTQAGIEALARYGTDEQRRLYLAPLVEGRWTGTMCLTEPQAGSDVGAVRTRAEPDGNAWRLFGQKIYITWGEHDLAENIVHLVLARTPDARDGTRGLSLFLVPKFLADEDGSLRECNDVRCVSIEHKLGINASPTCTLAFGDDGGARGFLVGREQAGMPQMFTMMNNARIAVGVEGLAIAERAFQAALAYARERTQGRGPAGPVPIVAHADVRRSLWTMRAQIDAMRALVIYASAQLDRAHAEPEADARAAAQDRVDLLTPVVKAWCTDLGCEIASAAIQVHGGMGFIEETGVAQHYRDARIAPIYEGTNGIQGLDLVGRKLRQAGGRLPGDLIGELRRDVDACASAGEADLARQLGCGLDALAQATRWLQVRSAEDPEAVAAGATPYLRLFGTVAGGSLLARAGLAGRDAPDPTARAKLASARFFASQLMPLGTALLPAITAGAEPLAAELLP
jgi:alkylation response protein AidB-like acyl-CoA dehydrogenase